MTEYNWRGRWVKPLTGIRILAPGISLGVGTTANLRCTRWAGAQASIFPPPSSLPHPMLVLLVRFFITVQPFLFVCLFGVFDLDLLTALMKDPRYMTSQEASMKPIISIYTLSGKELGSFAVCFFFPHPPPFFCISSLFLIFSCVCHSGVMEELPIMVLVGQINAFLWSSQSLFL